MNGTAPLLGDGVVALNLEKQEKSATAKFSRERGYEMSNVRIVHSSGGEDGTDQQYDRCVISVQGMTCASCVANIERNIGKVDGKNASYPAVFQVSEQVLFLGVARILVALIAGKADVLYDPSIIMPHQIANKIKDLGYDAKVIDNAVATDGKLEVVVS